MVLEKLRLDGPPRRVAIVTGGSRGLGKAMATSLSVAGADIAIGSRTESELNAAADEIERASGRRPFIVPTNVQSSAACDNLIARTVKHFGRLDIMLNNAGIGDCRGAGSKIGARRRRLARHDRGQPAQHVRTGSRAASRVFREQDQGGVIVNVASGTALRSSANSFGYAAAKAGVISLTKSLAGMLAGENIRVTASSPAMCHSTPRFAGGVRTRAGTRRVQYHRTAR